jgi:hypothetical protein
LQALATLKSRVAHFQPSRPSSSTARISDGAPVNLLSSCSVALQTMPKRDREQLGETSQFQPLLQSARAQVAARRVDSARPLRSDIESSFRQTPPIWVAIERNARRQSNCHSSHKSRAAARPMCWRHGVGRTSLTLFLLIRRRTGHPASVLHRERRSFGRQTSHTRRSHHRACPASRQRPSHRS